MKLQGIVRVSMIAAGLGVASLIASPVRAQQEIDPDTFDVNPGTPKAEIVTVAPVSAAPMVAWNSGQSVAISQAAIVSGSNWNGMFAAPLNAVDVAMLVILSVGTGFVALYTVVATRRRRHPSSEPIKVSALTSGATTH
jgi:hypothetical protein